MRPAMLTAKYSQAGKSWARMYDGQTARARMYEPWAKSPGMCVRRAKSPGMYVRRTNNLPNRLYFLNGDGTDKKSARVKRK